MVLTDKAGAEIKIVCRVAEADFSFGDGVVESISVPCRDGAFNVGVKWDEPSLGGPTWSASGGGRDSKHLLVTAAAPPDHAAVIGGVEMLPKWEALNRRFNRSPTPSEMEMDEDDWDNIDGRGQSDGSGSDSGGDGRRRPPDDVPEGTERVGHTLKPLVEYGYSDDDIAPELDDPVAGSFEATVFEGAHIKILMGRPAAWYGGLVVGRPGPRGCSIGCARSGDRRLRVRSR